MRRESPWAARTKAEQVAPSTPRGKWMRMDESAGGAARQREMPIWWPVEVREAASVMVSTAGQESASTSSP